MYSYKTIVDSLPAKKNSKSSLWVKTIVRKISFPTTWIFINCKCSPWLASMISVFVAVIGSAFMCVNSELFRIIGVILIEFWLVLDCVDGNIARVKKQSSEYGEFVDALSGYYVTGFVFVGLGVAAYNTSIFLPENNLWYVILGGITAVAGLLSRIIHQKFTYASMVISGSIDLIPEKEVSNKKSLQYLRSRLDKELGISGLFMPFLIVACIFHLYDVMIIFYLLFHAVGLVAVTLYYSLKAKR